MRVRTSSCVWKGEQKLPTVTVSIRANTHSPSPTETPIFLCIDGRGVNPHALPAPLFLYFQCFLLGFQGCKVGKCLYEWNLVLGEDWLSVPHDDGWFKEWTCASYPNGIEKVNHNGGQNGTYLPGLFFKLFQ
ncbi:hypothetical protein HNY73_012938 [Argiope bruennichi]|uniref:Uncharacterized protein n=1 Tax=Argiope bruennichi TaxID=94029 RepID=A0A8T0F116_ARGBR|nr:hypothetical protein HNY73_012938 [Argiope bruennichi]